ncbi:pyridoxal phosphate-dependent transferase [Gilbertella persicaria]|uniref:pyridoxal phosphate-dependent transferase n=1 Tax=Gilbertella persicaria TaxID=101096 RepID=UPI00221F79DC|nr:pyridoxal phosphate-dependent transferase [Gilbertella persicaria]KAI8063362.1 pyridoxal phosphate-dependent transferase [Gilbertella persicaria]
MSTEEHKPRFHLKDIAEKIRNKILAEHDSDAHQLLRNSPGNENKAHSAQDKGNVYGIEHPGSTGVIYVMDRATKNGYTSTNTEWSNFGQGAPEVGPIEGCMDRPETIDIPHDAYEYAPTSGTTELRTAVANLYNEIYRQGKESKYTHENVCIVPGGRAGLSRIASVIGNVNVGYFLPEYTAYEQMLSVFKRFVPIPATLDEESNYHIDPETIRKEIAGRGLGVIVASNPRNPTGQVIKDEELAELVDIARERHATFVMDEFYSAYIYNQKEGKTVSITEFVEDVNKDAVIVVDGLTKNFRMPGWRVCWIVGPKSVITAMEMAGSFLEGGANHPLQLAAIPFLDPEKFRNEAKALQRHFRQKKIIIVVPGIFFDVNPSHRRELFESPCHHFVRLSFGPPMDQLKLGLDHIERVIRKFTAKE